MVWSPANRKWFAVALVVVGGLLSACTPQTEKEKVSRRGSDEYEVQYTYTTMNADYVQSKKGYSRVVNRTMEYVNAPHELAIDEKKTRNRSNLIEQRRRRMLAERRFSLE